MFGVKKSETLTGWAWLIERARRERYAGGHYRPMLEALEDRLAPARAGGVEANGISINALQGVVFTLPLATFIDPNGAAGLLNYNVDSIDWGDGSLLDMTTGSIDFTGTLGSTTDPFSVSGTHTYADGGSYPITIILSKEGVQTVVNTDFDGPYIMDNWTSSGIAGGSTTINPEAGPTASAQFSYSVDLGTPGPGITFRTAEFSAIAATSGSISFDWNYTGFHGYFADLEHFEIFADSGAIRTSRTLVDANIEDVAFDFSGSATITISAGSAFGFIIGGGNFDFISQMSGTLTISNLTYLPEADVTPAPIATISGPSAVLAGANYTLNLDYKPLPGETVSNWTINWGDGGTPQVVPGTATSVDHVYATGSASVRTLSATLTSSVFGTVAANQLGVTTPLVTIAGVEGVPAGDTYNLQLSYQPNFYFDFITQWAINWGDGPDEIVTGNPQYLPHVYQAGSTTPYRITARATSSLYGEVPAANSVSVTVPVVTIAGNPAVAAGQPYVLSLSYTPLNVIDGVTDAVNSWTIFWGDSGSGESIAGETIVGNPATATHVYASGFTDYSIQARANSTVFGDVFASNSVEVNVAAAYISGPASVLAGELYTLELNYAPLSTGESIQSWIVSWGDGIVEAFVGNPSAVTHRYLGSPSLYVVNATAQSSLLGDVDANIETVVVPLVTISGAPSVLEGQEYTLYLSYVPSRNNGESAETIQQWTINWGDGVIQQIMGNPSSVTHVFTDAPNAYYITAFASSNFGDNVPAANSLLVEVNTRVVASSDSSVLLGPGAAVVTTPDQTATAYSFRTGTSNHPLVVYLAHYGQDPNLGDDPNTVRVGSTTVVTGPDGQRIETSAYDLRVNGASPGDIIVVRFAIPQPAVAPLLRFIDANGQSRSIVGSTNPALLALFGPTPRMVNGSFVVVFDFDTSFPTFGQLRGTVFTITDVAGFIPPLFNLFAQGQNVPRNLAANQDVLGALLGGGDDDDDGGTQLAAVAPTQASAFAQGGSGADAAEEAEHNRRRELLRTVESILEQLRQMFGMQLQLLTAAGMALAQPSVDAPPEDCPPPRVGSDPFEVLDDDAGPQPRPDEVAVPIDPFLIAEDDAPTLSSFISSQMLTCVALVALPFVPWSEVLVPVREERRTYPMLR